MPRIKKTVLMACGHSEEQTFEGRLSSQRSLEQHMSHSQLCSSCDLERAARGFSGPISTYRHLLEGPHKKREP